MESVGGQLLLTRSSLQGQTALNQLLRKGEQTIPKGRKSSKASTKTVLGKSKVCVPLEFNDPFPLDFQLLKQIKISNEIFIFLFY